MDAIRTLLCCGVSQLSEESRDRLLAQATAEFKAAGEQGSRVLALLIENLVHSRSPCAIWALRAAGAVEPTPELLAALRLIAWAGVRRSGQRGRFEPELVRETDFVGWSPGTHRTVKALAARALRELSAGEARSATQEAPLGGEDAAVAASRAVCMCCGRPGRAAQTIVLYSARVLKAGGGEVPDYRELRVHRYEVCASCSRLRQRRTLIALAALVVATALVILARTAAPFLFALGALATASFLGLLFARRSSLATRLQRKALQERRAHPVLGGKPGFQIVGQPVMIWPFTRPVPPGVPREAACDVCGRRVAYAEGYCLTTAQVIGEPRYWEHGFRHQWSQYRDAGPKSSEVAALAKQEAGRSTTWLVCEDCIPRFAANRETARFESRIWWVRGQQYAPESAGPGNVGVALQAARTGWERACGPS